MTTTTIGERDRKRRRVRRPVRHVVLAAATLASLLVGIDVGSAVVSAQTEFTVGTTDDVEEFSLDGACAEPCSLREAVAEANAVSGAQINLPAGSYALSFGPLQLSAPMTITGAARQPGPLATTIDGNSSDRVLEISSSGVTLEGLVITGGSVDKGDGGGVLVNRNIDDVTIRTSTITGNTAKNGGGVSTLGGLTVDRSTFTGNTATGSGGGIDVGNRATLVVENSTFDSNTANDGGGIASAGATTLRAVTVTSNESNSSSGGGVSRGGGTLDISGSILAGNIGSNAPRDCSGSPTFAAQNIVESTPGCNPTGTPLLVADPQLGALTDNGGPTQTRLPSEGSPAIDAVVEGVEYTPCVTDVDQRDVPRTPTPPGDLCDIGAVEVAPLSVDVTLAVRAEAPDAPCPDGVTCVGVGVSSVPVDRIPSESIVATVELPEGETEATYARRTYARRTYARRTYARRTDLVASAVADVTLEELYARRTYARRTSPVEQVLLSDIPLYLDDGRTWEDLLVGTSFEGVPLQYITLFDVLGLPQVAGLTIGEADITTTALQDLSGVALALAPLSLNDIPFGDEPDGLAGWCSFIEGELGAGACADLGIDPGVPTTADDVGLVTLQLAGVNIEAVGIEEIYARRTDISGTYLESIYARRTDLAASDIGSIYARRTDRDGNDISALLEALVDCGLVDCDDQELTLADVQLAGALKGDATPSDVDDATIADLLAYLATQAQADQISLFDLLLSLTVELFPGDGVAFEQIDLRATPLQNESDPLEDPATFTATITVGGGAPADTTVALTLPDDFEPVADSALLDGAPIPDGVRDGQTLTFVLPVPLSVGEHALSVDARAGVDLGSREASVQVDATAGSQEASDSDTTTVLVVVESFEKNGSADDFREISQGTINVGHISSSYDVDLYSFYVSPDDAKSGVTARIALTNDNRDYDLVLYGPKLPSLRGTEPISRLQPLADTQVGFDTAGQQLPPDIQLDVGREPLLGGQPLDCGGVPCFKNADSAQRGDKDELIETGTLIAGTYWIQVTGFNGDFGPEPYTLRYSTDRGEGRGVCDARTPSTPTGSLVTYPDGVTAEDVAGYILVPEGRLRQTYGDAINAVMTAVDEVAAATSNAVVRIDAAPSVDGAYDAWDGDPCSTAASNDVVRAIGVVLDQLDETMPNASTVTLVGDHIMIPMGLVVDGNTIGNENTYDPGVERGFDTSLTAALKAGYVMTDTPYAASAGYLLNAAELYVPDRAVGRLVETPTEITATLERFVDPDFAGVLDPDTTTSAFVAGYDFIADGAAATADVIDQQIDPGKATRLIRDDWKSTDLEKGLIDDDPDLASVSAHFDHNRAVPALADVNPNADLFRTSDVRESQSAVNLLDALVLSIGCHSGLPVPDVELRLTDTDDWTQTFAERGATYFGNTGYGYGDSELVAYSERLQELFAEQLRTGATVGAAMMAAKQAYFAELAAVSTYDAKVLSEWTLYGLPMWQVGGDYGDGVTDAPTDEVADGPVLPTSAAQPPVELIIGGTPGPNVLSLNTTEERGDYYDQDGNTIAAQFRPVVPSLERDVTVPGRRAHGVFITDAESTDIPGFRPYFSRPLIDQSDNEALLDVVGDAVFPTTLARVTNTVQADGTIASKKTVALGQFRRDLGETPGVGTQRLFTRLDTEVTYADPSVTDFDAPRIVRSEGSVVDQTVGFTIRTATDATRVFVLYKIVGPEYSDWAGVDLVNTGAECSGSPCESSDPDVDTLIWTGGAVLPGPNLQIEFLGQVSDFSGNISYTVNKTSNYLAAPAEDCSERFVNLISGGTQVAGWYVAPNGVSVTFTDPDAVVSVDGGPFSAAPGGVVVSGEGVHQVRVRSGGDSCTIPIPIDTRAPAVSATIDPAANDRGWHEGDVSVSLRAVDPGGSGVAQLFSSIDGGTYEPVSSDRVTVPVTSKGTTTIRAYAVDAAGNSGANAPIEVTVKIDDTGPTITSVEVSPEPNAAGWNNTSPVTVSVTATDAETDVREIRTAVGDEPAGVTPGASATADVPFEGETIVSYVAVDRAGNETAGSTTVKIDETAPEITITSPPESVAIGSTLMAAFECSDDPGTGIAFSDVASCTATLTGPGVADQPVANGDALPTAGGGSYTLTVTASDVAGNSTISTRTYAVVYGVCPQYQVDNPQPIGGTYALKFQLCDGFGANLSSPQIEVRAVTIDGDTTPPPNFQGKTNLGDLFRYSPRDKFYIYNLETDLLAAGPHTLEFTVDGADPPPPAYVLDFVLKD